MDDTANPLMDRKVFGLSDYLSVYLSVCILAYDCLQDSSMSPFAHLEIFSQTLGSGGT